MANVHGFNDLGRNQGPQRGGRQQMGMPTGPGAQDPLLAE